MQFVRNRTYGSATVVASNSVSSTLVIPARTEGLRIAIEIENKCSQTILRGPDAASVANGAGLRMAASEKNLLGEMWIDNGAIHMRSSNTSTGSVAWIEYWR